MRWRGGFARPIAFALHARMHVKNRITIQEVDIPNQKFVALGFYNMVSQACAPAPPAQCSTARFPPPPLAASVPAARRLRGVHKQRPATV